MYKKWLYIIILLALSYEATGQHIRSYGFESAPYLQNLQENSVSIYWIMNRSSTSWVEYGSSSDLGKIARNSSHGLFDANLPVQKAYLKGLQSATDYYYRTASVEIVQYGAYNVIFGDTVYSEIKSFRTPSAGLSEFSFIAFNDVHDRPAFIKDVIAWEDDFDFVAYLGDIMGHIDYTDDIINSVLKPSASFFAGEKPFYWVRGNHEARGSQARKLIDYIDVPGNKYFYTFNYGPAFFIVLDAGEDKPDTNQYYFSLADFDNYRYEQSLWLKEVVESSEYKSARFRIVLTHFPIYLSEVVASDEIHRHGRANVQENFAKLLNESGVDLLLCGHTHRYHIAYPEENVTNFHVVVGGGHIDQRHSTYTVVDFSGDKLNVRLKSSNDGSLIEQFTVNAR